MSLEGLQERLTALQETTTQLRDLIDRLANLEFQPGAVPLGTEEESSVSGELSAEIGQILRSGLEEQELLREEVRYVRPEGHDKARLQDGVDRLGGELACHRGAFRKARLAAKQSLERAERQERELLVQSFSVPVSEATSPALANDEAPGPIVYRPVRYTQQREHKRSRLSEEDQQTVGASSNVTNALRRTHDLIAAELSRSEFAHQTLTESYAALKQLNESYTSLDSMLARSRDLLGTLLRSQKSDTWYLQTALYMLLVTGAWLVFRRILYGPMWWLVWLPMRILFGVGTRAGSAVMQGKSGPGETGRVQVGGEGANVPVEGLPNDDLPTAQVGQETGRRLQDGDADSMVDGVGKIIDAAKEAAGRGAADGETDAGVERGNSKKRMWEETQGVGGDGPVRDEL
ncbi:hypothetical protein TOPH_00136 [Tolypocladium ophioglossoides CBS 100239]|uniref:Sec20 C-terminal domain-containing protein n=1 Tax=Tolypocladium ophioglossoides (strain CBS 100239) TaxID=1163406 RepID=A0A0L0NM45_TOLOC|nr:hypothetical protein TOPH_00136 [Tolypocladium ophioglossoides CBS 100239]